MSLNKTVLIVDDNRAICDALTVLLSLEEIKAIACQSPAEALEMVTQQSIALVIQDMNFTADTTSGDEGKALFYQLRKQRPELAVILLTAWTQLEMAISLVKAGAVDYIAKPWDDEKLIIAVKNALKIQQLTQDNQRLTQREQQRQQLVEQHNLCGLVHHSVEMQRLVDIALQVAPSRAAVLITGPNGAGKEKIADIIHYNSPFKDKPFIKLNAGALAADLIEAELFGVEAGAYTGAFKTRVGRFEAADGGTLFLDEIANLPLSGQMKLLRVIQTGEFERLGSNQTRRVSIRIISATNADLQAAIAQGNFREDLYYRLNVIELKIQALNQRKDDIMALARHFIPTDKRFSLQAETILLAHNWPGNVRELENRCHRAALLASSDEITPEDLDLATQPITTITSSVALPIDEQHITSEMQKRAIEQCLSENDGVISATARALGLSRQSLYRRIEKLNITPNNTPHENN